ncbi:MAG: transcriptional regulator [Phyllobacteriaceae bacterium]|nr:transcriptional regulator [Nitratireductor sp.]MCO5135769.1 transcriptional regulator [Phyllobacteriaceae bacterium]
MTPSGEEDDDVMVFIILGEVRRAGEETMRPFNALLTGADDDSAVRSCLEALAQQGYEEANLHQIGNLEEAPDEEPFASAYQAALEGEIALIAYDDEEIDGLGSLQ